MGEACRHDLQKTRNRLLLSVTPSQILEHEQEVLALEASEATRREQQQHVDDLRTREQELRTQSEELTRQRDEHLALLKEREAVFEELRTRYKELEAEYEAKCEERRARQEEQLTQGGKTLTPCYNNSLAWLRRSKKKLHRKLAQGLIYWDRLCKRLSKRTK
eukprot:gene15522-21610_t